MLDRHAREALLPGAGGSDEEEGWLMSYLDVLTLLITLFVLLLSMAGQGPGIAGSELAERPASPAPVAQASALAVAGGLGPAASGLQPRHTGLQPRHTGLQPRLSGLDTEGVSIVEDEQGITLRIDDNLLFASGQATLTSGGGQVLQGLMGMLEAFDGQVSVEGHTDSLPIATARFPSNWELSTARAIAVLRFLAEAGVARTRLRAIGYADTRPLESNLSAAGRAANRRVELLLTR